MDSKPAYTIQVVRLDSPIYIAGQEVRVKHGTPECFSTIAALCTKFLEEDIPSEIQNKTEPIKRFGMCINHVYYEDIIEFTYIIGVQVHEKIEESKLPGETKCYSMPTGDYACINVTSPNESTTIGIAYTRLGEWINASQDWESAMGEYEVYPDISTRTQMELWRPVRIKSAIVG